MTDKTHMTPVTQTGDVCVFSSFMCNGMRGDPFYNIVLYFDWYL